MNAIEARLFDSEPVRPLRRSEFLQLHELGCFRDERVELLYGFVVLRLPPSPEHEESLFRVSNTLVLALHDRANVRTNMSFAASDISLPVPDVLVAPLGSYWREHPGRAYLAI